MVGGGVRDLLLERPSLDLDLVVEGQAISLAQELAKAMGWEVVTHPHFGTAKISWGNFHLDLATARCETYTRPGALPTVRPGTIEEDLFRRDFTINALAVNLAPAHFGELLDLYGGKKDLELGLVRVLHELSFQDDPTRILRGIRYEQRLGFRLEEKTEELARRDSQVLELITGERLWRELELTLEEAQPEKSFLRMADLGVLQRVHVSLDFNGWLAGKFREARAKGLLNPTLYLGLLVSRLSEEEVESLIRRLKPPGWARRAMREVPKLRKYLPTLAEASRPSEVCRELEGYREEVIRVLALVAESAEAKGWLELYLSQLRFIMPELNGEDLKGMGVPPGRKMGRLLAKLKEARLNGEVGSREEEMDLLQRLLKES